MKLVKTENYTRHKKVTPAGYLPLLRQYWLTFLVYTDRVDIDYNIFYAVSSLMGKLLTSVSFTSRRSEKN